MSCKFVAIPSVVERYTEASVNTTSDPEKRIQLYETGISYLVGEPAPTQGNSAYRNTNSSPMEIDYQLLAKAGLLVASGARSGEIVLTTGFPYATYEQFRQQAIDFFTPRDVFIGFSSDKETANFYKRIQLTIRHMEVIPEILGCITAVRKGPIAEKGNFFIVSLGYGTCETGLSTEAGLISRTCMSAPGLRNSINKLNYELGKSYNWDMQNEHAINQSFQNGKVVINRKRKDLTEIRRNNLADYYNKVVSPTIKKAFNDTDFEKTDTIYLVGEGARYIDLVDCFRQEFGGVLNIIVPEDAERMASLGYYLRSYQWCGKANAHEAIGLDIGNTHTVVCQHMAANENVELTGQLVNVAS